MNPDDLQRLAPAFLGRQRWFGGEEPEKVRIEDYEVLREEWPKLVWSLIDADHGHYQLLVGGRPMGEPAEFLGGHESGVLGEADGAFWYDATFDPYLALVFLDIVTQGKETAKRVRPIGVEQSNSSVVYDERIICKTFRRVQPGHNPDVEVTMALAEAGFTHVAEPVAAWHRDGYDLAFVQKFLANSSEGWALAITSLRDLYAEGPNDPGQAGGDFSGEANRLGQVTAEMHLALAEAFGAHAADAGGWADGMLARLSHREIAAALEPNEVHAAERVYEDLRRLKNHGQAIRVHGDYHLGQVMRTDTGWYVLDFEGEPARSVEERRLPGSAMKDVSGMVRSFDYATRSALGERPPTERAALTPLAEAWTARNCSAFLEGYRGTPGIDSVLPGDEKSFDTVLRAFELDKAIYELGYELAYRPDWAEIPREAIRRLTFG